MTAPNPLRQPSTIVRVLFFIFLAVEGFAALVVLAAIPPDPKNSLLLGYSLNRLALMAAAVGVMLAAVWLAFRSARRSPGLEGLLNPQRRFGLCLALLLGISAAAWLAMIWLRADPDGRLASYSARLRPLLVLFWLLGWQSAAWLWIERYGLPRFDLRAASPWLRPAAVAGGALALLSGLIAVTGLGITPDLYAWNTAGVPLLAWQIGAAAVVGILAFVASRHVEKLKGRHALWLDLTIVLVIWVIAASAWLSQPITPSYYAPLRPPNDAYYPYSDASYYDLSAQQVLIGNGYNRHAVVTRPLYILFLVLSHALVGQDYARVVTVQTILLALFPVCMYLLGRITHSRAAGITLALLVTVRELNAIAATPLTEVSHSKLLLTDFPTTLGVAAFCLLAMVWLRAPHRRWLPLAAGGGLGFLVLLRAQAVMFLPFIPIAALLVYRRRLRWWVEACLLFGFGLGLVISPWLARNYTLTGKIVFDQSTNQTVIFGQRYSTTANALPTALPGESAEQFSARMMDIARQFVFEHPAYTARFIAAHFLNNEVATLAVLPFSISLDDYRDNLLLTSLFWSGTFTELGWQEFLLLAGYLGLIAVGMGSAWQRLGMAGLVPLILNLAYSLSNAVARNSGWRYILPVDWVGLFYVCIGLLALVGWLLGRTPASSPAPPIEPRGRFPWRFILALSAGLVALAAVIPLAETAFPPRFPAQTRADLALVLAEKVPVDASAWVGSGLLIPDPEDGSVILRGLAFYPRFYHSGQGEIGSGWPAFHVREGSRLAFFVVGPEGNQQVLLPLENQPDTFPNGSEVLIMGCRLANQSYIQAKLVMLVGEPDQVFVSHDHPANLCP